LTRYFTRSHEFLYGRRDFVKSAECAFACPSFTRDNDEEEEISNCEVSCYNCLYRRWTAASFRCMKDMI